MKRLLQPKPLSFISSRVGDFVATVSILLLIAVGLFGSTQAQTYTIIHTFDGCAGGYEPMATLILDGAGKLYGTTAFGGSGCSHQGRGLAFRLQHAGNGWVEMPIHTFMGGPGDGYEPFNYGGLTIGGDGTLYGTTNAGGEYNLGTVFRLQPTPTTCQTTLCPWLTTLLYSFNNSGPGGYDLYGNVVFDSAGNLYGTTVVQNGVASGTAFKLANSDGSWTEENVYQFGGGVYSLGGLTFDPAGNLYGVTYNGGEYGSGTVFELTPSGSGWAFNTLYTFTAGSDGSYPIGAPVLDQAGNIYGTTSGDGSAGTVYELSPSGSGRTFQLLYGFQGHGGPESSVTLDANGNLYGTTTEDGAFGQGMVFKLTHNGDGWAFTDLHDFLSGQNGDGSNPLGGVTLDSSGNLYGTTSAGGTYGAGIAWEITP